MTGPMVIFDCDGVLIDSESIGLQIELEGLRRIGCSVSEEEYHEAALGRTEEELIWRSFAERSGVPLPPSFVERTRRKVAEAFDRELTVIPGVEEALSRLPYPTCVASGSRQERLRRNLHLTGLDRFFGGRVFSATQVERGKPFPDLFLFVAREMGVDPGMCLVVEDSPAGVRAARAAHMEVVGFVGGSHCLPSLESRLVQLGAGHTFRRMVELPAICRRFAAGLNGTRVKGGRVPDARSRVDS
jgi:HAD superfamily hydrolase (TIGR01509 family)